MSYYGITRDDVRGALSRYENKPADGHAYGVVKALNADGSYDIVLDGSTEATRCAACCTASVGDRVLVLVKANGKCDAIGRLGGVVSAAELDELEALLGISGGGE